jgi:hypothetical protein
MPTVPKVRNRIAETEQEQRPAIIALYQEMAVFRSIHGRE